MSYPATIVVFDEDKVQSLLKEIMAIEADDFFKRYTTVLEKAGFDEYELETFREDVDFLKQGELEEFDSLILNLAKMTAGKIISLDEFSHFQYGLGFFDYLKKRHEESDKGTVERSDALKLLTGFLKEASGKIWDFKVLGTDPSGIRGYASKQVVQDAGRDAIAMLSEMEIKAENRQIFSNSGWHEMEPDDESVMLYSMGRDKLAEALRFALENKMAVILFT